MKVIAYKRSAASEFHVHAGSYATCFYIPDLRCVIGTETMGTFGRADNFASRDPDILKETEKLETEAMLIAGHSATIGVGRGVTLSEVKVLDLDEAFIKGIVSLLDVLAAAREESEKSMKLLLEDIK